jgi:hypothetical protein
MNDKPKREDKNKKDEKSENRQAARPKRTAVKAVWILSLLLVLTLVGGYLYVRAISAEHERDLLELKHEQGQNQPRVTLVECRTRLEGCQKDLDKCERMLSGYQDNR